MSDNEIQIQKLFLYEPTYASTCADIYVGQSSNPNRSTQQLILIIRYPRSRHTEQSLLTTIIQQAVRAFEDSRHATPELTLEAILETVNIALPDIAPHKDPRWLESLTLLVAISDRGQIHFAHLGDIDALLIQQASLTRVSENQGRFNPLKLFSHITSGLLDPGNAMIFTTSSLLDYISGEKIKKLLHELPPRIVEQRLERLLSQVPPSVSFEAVLIKFTTELDELAERGYRAAQDDDREPDVARPSFATPVDGREPVEQAPRNRTVRNFPRRAWGVASFFRIFFRALGAYFVLVYTAIIIGVRALWRLIVVLISHRQRTAHEQHYIRVISQRYEDLRAQLFHVSRRSRFILFSAILIGFVLLHVVMIKGQFQHVQRAQSTFDETLVRIAEKKHAVDNAIIYNDDKTAEQALVEINSLLRGITPLNKAQEDQIAQYLEDTRRDLNKVRHINDIPSPLVAADLGAAEKKFESLVTTSDGSYLVSSGAELSRWKDGKLTPIASASSAIERILVSGSNVFVLTADQKLLKLSGQALAPASITMNANQKEIAAAILYANNLYLLDTSGVLYKYNGTSSGIFSAGFEWGRDTTLAGGLDIAIDGNLYVLTSNGRILKYARGQRVDFTYHEPNPRVGAQGKLVTSKESNFLYLLDSDNDRLIVLEKQGPTKDQFTSREFTHLTDLAVSIDESSIALLGGTKIYLIAINR